MSSLSEIKRVNGIIFGNLCRFCGKLNCNKEIDNSWNEVFFDVNKKLFSFTVETLNGLKICTSCVEIIDSICKFYNQVQNVSQMLIKTENSITDDSFSISKYGSKHQEINISGKTHERLIEIDHQVTAVEKNSFQIEEINADNTPDKNIAQEVIKVEKHDNFTESEDYLNCCDTKSKDSLSTLPFQSSKEENVNEVNCINPPIKTPSEKENEHKIYKTIVNDYELKEPGKLLLPTGKKCPYCGGKYSSKKNMKRHIRRQHLTKNPVSCKICNQVFATRYSLKLHRINSKCPSGFKCEVCDEKFSNKSNLERHKISHWTAEEKEANAYKCPHCENKYLVKAAMQLHIRLYHENKDPFVCKICNRVYKYKNSLRQHKKIFHEKTISKKMYKCEICGKTLASRTVLKHHKKLHLSADERSAAFFKCPHCEYQYPSRGTMLHHVRIQHLKEKPLCETCGKEFGNNWSLKLHRATHNVKEKQYYECEICCKKYTTRSNLELHKDIHCSVENKKYGCEICSKKYTTPENLKIHKKLHVSSGNGHFECEICAKKYINHVSFKLHKKMHSCEDKHECEICGKKCTTSGNLKIHKNIHISAEDRQFYKCEICGKEYSTPANLKTHKKVHLPDEENKKTYNIFKCPHCDAGLSSKQSMLRHIRTIHLNERFTCKTCDKAYTTKRALQIHEEKVHK